MKRPFVFFLFFANLFLASGQEMKISLASNFQAENQVVKLDIQAPYYPLQFKLGIVKQDRVYFKTFYARKGLHYYDLRTLDEWSGKVDYLVTNLDNRFIRAYGIEDSDLKKDWDIFLDKDELTLTSVNFFLPKTFNTQSITFILFFLAILLSAGFFLYWRNWIPSIFSALIIVSVLFDSRSLVDHVRALQQVEQNALELNPLQFIKPFTDEALPLIKGRWSTDGELRDEYFFLWLKYAFANFPFVRSHRASDFEGTFIVSRNKPEKEELILLFRDGYYLYQQP